MSSPSPSSPFPYDLLLHRLSQHVRKQPNKIAVGWLSPGPNGGKLEQTVTYQELWNRTDQLAQRLQSTTTKGDRIILVFPPSLHFMMAFLACCKVGLVAVPVFPPHPARRDTLAMFTNIVLECGAKVALTNHDYQHAKQLAGIKDALLRFKRPAGSWPEHLQWIVTDQLDGKSSNATPPSPISIEPSDVAFLQYTSGSTSSPKGVMITQGNLAHNLTIITNELQAHSDDTIVVSWLPQYHDMGLIGSYLGVLYCGGTGYYMSPLAFLQRPVMWMEAVSVYQATHLQGPNFAFKLVARKFQPSDYTSTNTSPKLNLSSVRHVINAAEPVDEESIDSFAKAFVPFGFKSQVMYPTYGLAEHTVFVCSGGQQRLHVHKEQLEVHGKVVVVGDEETEETKQDADHDGNNATAITKLVGCGYPSRQGVDVRIVHVETLQELPPDQVGEIWIDSPSKAAGYFGKPDETQADFHAPLEQPAAGSAPVSANGYLRTGDLGFFHQNELFICGRLKDLIIVGGRNYYPQDIEATAEAAASEKCRPGCSAAFSIDPTKQAGGEEEICLVMELRELVSGNNATATYIALAEIVRAAISQEHSLSLAVLVLLKPKTVPKTSSGKIARAWCRKAYVGKTLDAVYQKSFKTTTGTLEIDGTTSSPPSAAAPALTSSQMQNIRQMDKKDVLERLRRDVATMASVQPDMISPDMAIATILDSLSLSQFKGLLQSHYAVQALSDEYLFRESTTLTKLVEIVHLGFAPDDTANGGGSAEASGVVAHSGSAGGIAGAMGCPPGVVCCVIQ